MRDFYISERVFGIYNLAEIGYNRIGNLAY